MFQYISDTAYVLDAQGGVGPEVFSEPGHEHVHAAGNEEAVFFPDCFEEYVAGDYFIAMAEKDLEHFAFFVREAGGGTAGVQGKVVDVEYGVSGFEDGHAVGRGGRAERSFQNGLHAVSEFFDAEGFAYIVVGPYLETADAIFRLAPGGEENDGHLLVVLAYFLGQIEAIAMRQHDVENAEVECMAVKGGKTFFAVGV